MDCGRTRDGWRERPGIATDLNATCVYFTRWYNDLLNTPDLPFELNDKLAARKVSCDAKSEFEKRKILNHLARILAKSSPNHDFKAPPDSRLFTVFERRYTYLALELLLETQPIRNYIFDLHIRVLTYFARSKTKQDIFLRSNPRNSPYKILT